LNRKIRPTDVNLGQIKRIVKSITVIEIKIIFNTKKKAKYFNLKISVLNLKMYFIVVLHQVTFYKLAIHKVHLWLLDQKKINTVWV
jgi:hypothetical protein